MEGYIRLFIVLTGLVFSNALFAFSCPVNGNVVKTGYSVEQAIAACGKPVSQEKSKKTVITSEEWVYYKKSNQLNEKATLFLKNGRLVNISLETPDPACSANQGCNSVLRNSRNSNFCKRLIQAGNNANYIRAACGAPDMQKVISNFDVNIVKLKYKGVAKNTLVFENDRLVNWEF